MSKGFPKGICFNTGRTHFKKGHTPWCKGKKMADYPQRGFQKGNRLWDNLSTKKNWFIKGQKMSEEIKKKMRLYKGEKAHNWQGGIHPLNLKIRALEEYFQWRDKIFKRDNYTCQKCNKRGGDLETHHKKPFYKILQEFLQQYNQFSPIEDKETLVRLAMTYQPFWNLDNGKTLCKKCHNLTKNERRKNNVGKILWP